MRRWNLAVLAAVLAVGWTMHARAQGYGVQGDACSPERNIFGGFMAPSTQRQQACLDLRKSQWDDYHARQKADQDQKDAAAARQREEQAAAQAEQLAAERRQERAAREQHRVAYFAEVAAERSADNHCRVPDIARALMTEWNDFDQFKELNIRVVDIEHLTTKKFDPETGEMACHGLFKTTRGMDLLGTLSTRKNVAGDPIFSWNRDEVQDLSLYVPPAADDVVASTQTVVTTPDHAGEPEKPVSFSTGLADRQRWEAWLGGLSGDQRDGATWWATNRNSPHHVGCDAAPEKDNATWEAGCLNAQQMLTPIDLKRRSDPVYKKGWNSF